MPALLNSHSPCTPLFYSLFSSLPSSVLSSALLISDGCDDQLGFPHCLDPLRGCQLLEHVSLPGAGPHDTLCHAVTMPLR